MNFQSLYKQYTPNFLGFIGFHTASICFPKISPLFGIWYHGREIMNNFNHTDSLNKEIEVQLPGECQPIAISCKAEVNSAAVVSNIYGLSESFIDLGQLIFQADDYTKCTMKYLKKHIYNEAVCKETLEIFLNSKVAFWSKIFYSVSLMESMLSYISTTKEYDFIDKTTGENIDPYLITHPKTKILCILNKEQTEDYQESNDLLISPLESTQDNIEAITIPCA